MTKATRVALRAFVPLSLAACASASPPPGGPPDSEPPRLVKITPDTGAVSVRPPKVVFRFDEVVSERPQGAATLAGLAFSEAQIRSTMDELLARAVTEVREGR